MPPARRPGDEKDQERGKRKGAGVTGAWLCALGGRGGGSEGGDQHVEALHGEY